MTWAGVGAGAGTIAGGLLGSKSAKIPQEQKNLMQAQADQAHVQTAGMADRNLDFNQLYAQAAALGMDPSTYVAQLSPQQRQAMGLTSSSLGFGQSDNDALRGTIGGANYGNFGAKDISEFMNPYTDSVVNATNADINRQRQIALVGGEGAANAAGAFGGSRHGVADALTNEAALRTTADTDANLRSQGFTTAANLASQRANQVGGFKVAGNQQLMQLLQQKYNMNAGDIDRLFNSGAVDRGADQDNKSWATNRLKLMSGVLDGYGGTGATSFPGAYPTQPNTFASTIGGANWGANVGGDIAKYFTQPRGGAVSAAGGGNQYTGSGNGT